MDDEKILNLEEVEEDAKTAEALAAEAREEPDRGCYVHTLKKPFTWKNETYTELRFEWEALTGTDHLAVANELERRGRHLVVPQFDGNFLAGIAARACTARDEKGKRAISTEAVRALPIGDFQAVINEARSFLLRAGPSLI